MPKYKMPVGGRSPALVKAEEAGQKALLSYFRSDFGLQAKVSRATGIVQVVLSRMANHADYPIAMEAAIKIEVATEGALKAETLCPSCADVLQKFVAARTKAVA